MDYHSSASEVLECEWAVVQQFDFSKPLIPTYNSWSFSIWSSLSMYSLMVCGVSDIPKSLLPWIGQIPVDGWCRPPCPRTSTSRVTPACPPPGPPYKGTWDVIQRVVRKVCLPAFSSYRRAYILSYWRLIFLPEHQSVTIWQRIWSAFVKIGMSHIGSGCYRWSSLRKSVAHDCKILNDFAENSSKKCLIGVLAACQNKVTYVTPSFNFQEGFFRLWRGLNASLAISVPTVRKLPLLRKSHQFGRINLNSMTLGICGSCESACINWKCFFQKLWLLFAGKWPL